MRHCSFAQESTRYVKYEGDMEFIKPVWCKELTKASGAPVQGISAQQVWLTAMERAEADYKALLQNGWKAQQAREILPNSLKTEIVMKANIREWRHIFALRCAKASHPQMVELMRPLLKEVQKKIPVVFDDLIF